MENPSSIRDFDCRIDTGRHRLVAALGALVGFLTLIWALSVTAIPYGIAVFALFDFD